MNLSQYLALVQKVGPRAVAVGGFTAVGTLLISNGVPWAWSQARPHTHLVSVFAQPDEPDIEAMALTPPKPSKSCPSGGLVDVATAPTHLESEDWDAVTSDARLSARVTSSDGTGHADVAGFDIRQSGASPRDTIAASYKGEHIGRGTYYLNREYGGASHNQRKQEWWHGYQVSYDCHLQIAIKCPYLLGEKKYEEQMRNDVWLKQSCTLENPLRPVKEASRDGGQFGGG